MSGLLDDIKNEGTKVGPQCGVRLALEAMSKADRVDLEAALADRINITAAQITRALAKRNIDIQASTLLRHRKRECGCGKS